MFLHLQPFNPKDATCDEIILYSLFYFFQDLFYHYLQNSRYIYFEHILHLCIVLWPLCPHYYLQHSYRPSPKHRPWLFWQGGENTFTDALAFRETIACIFCIYFSSVCVHGKKKNPSLKLQLQPHEYYQMILHNGQQTVKRVHSKQNDPSLPALLPRYYFSTKEWQTSV